MFYLLMVHHQATVVDLPVVIFLVGHMSKKSTFRAMFEMKNFKDGGVKHFDPIALH